MNITAAQLVTRFGAEEIAAIAVPKWLDPLTPDQMSMAANGDDLSQWDDAAKLSAQSALSRIDTVSGRATTELAYYLRFRAPTADAPIWLQDDALELARYHLYDAAGNADSTVRLRYQDVIKRLKALMDEDAANDVSEGDTGGAPTVISNPRVFSRHTLRRF
ncbi:phage protein Gp36 family protein [Luteibacter sp.]|jgi:phage gp36-like protein|uniref:phage protein Gp36 family protein n=1 Tax=Luteibacter sp. TaxID=1886636 RepID=UPI002F414001